MPVVHITKDVGLFEDHVVIDRSSRWGNPFFIGKDGTRTDVIAKFKAQLWEEIKEGTVELEELAELDGKTLACWCAPLACHGDVLIAAAAWASNQLGLAPEDRRVQ